MKRILFIGGHDSRELVEAAERRGIELVFMLLPVVLAKTAVGGAIVAVEPLHLDQPLSGIVQSIVEVAKRYDVSGIVPVMEFGLMPATVAAAKLGLPAHSLKAVRVTRDKMMMRRTLDAAGLRQIAHAACRTLEEARQFFAGSGGPIIVKPVSGSGSDGVTRVDDASQLEEAWSRATGSLAFTGVICEEYIHGPEVSVEGYCTGGVFVPVAITDKTTDEHFVEIGHDQPSRYPAAVQQRVFDYTARVLAALSVTDGWTHTEVRLGSDDPLLVDPVIIETHTRRGGASIDHITWITTGVSTNDVTFDFALGLTPSAYPRDTGRSAVVRFINGPPGVIESVTVPELPDSGVAAVQIDLQPGDSVVARASSASRIGRLVGTGRDAAEAATHAEAFRARIHIHYTSALDEQRETRWITPAA
ncbi:MAG: ATP-grasp domain-containing protein [Acidobacteriota bacterium]